MSIRIPAFAMGRSIPKSIYQTSQVKTLPEKIRKNIDSMVSNNPGYSYRLFDEEDRSRFIFDVYGKIIYKLYDRISAGYGAARADLFRYLLIYNKGGIYLDLKSRFERPIDEVIAPDDAYILSQWRNGAGERHEGWGLHGALHEIPRGEFQQWHVIAVAGHPFLRAVIKRVLRGIARYSIRRNEVGWPGVLGLTGPVAYTLAIAPLLGRYPYRLIHDETSLGLEYNILDNDAHKGLFGRHYTTLLHPVILQPFPRGQADRLHVAARRWRKARREADPSA